MLFRSVKKGEEVGLWEVDKCNGRKLNIIDKNGRNWSKGSFILWEGIDRIVKKGEEVGLWEVFLHLSILQVYQ